MSSVVIAGDISGSVTLDAPSVAGTTVLTLPATSGTVVTTATSSGISGSAITTGTVATNVGGTGITSFTANGAMYATSTSALTTGTLPVASGGTGATALTANNVILGNGTSAVQFVAPGSSGNVLTSNGTTWTSAAAGGGQFQTQLFTSPGTWTRPASTTQVRVTVVGGSGAAWPSSASGDTSSFGPAVSATGGTSLTGPGGTGSPGSGSVSVGTALKTGSMVSPASNIVAFGNLAGLSISPHNPSPAALAYSTSLASIAGAAMLSGPGTAKSGAGGIAMAIVPVSNPVAVTVGAGGGGGAVGGGIGGAVLVEFVG